MQVALVSTKEEPKTMRRMSAEEFAAELALNPDLIAQTQVFDLDTLNPAHFRRAHTRFGGEENVRACFAFAAGYAPSEDHIFGHKRENISVIEAAKSGKKILLSLNADLTNRPVNYRALRDPLTMNLEDWMAEHRGNYFIQSVKTAEDLVALVRRLHEEVSEYSLNHNLRVLHRGAVMRYQQFFVRATADNFHQLYHTMCDQIAGMATDQTKTRIIGFPRLVEFSLGKKTQEQKGVRGFRSTSYPDGDALLFNQLVINGHKDNPHVLQREWEQVTAKGLSFYVLAAPVISGEATPGWEQIRWVINDIEAQLAKKNLPPAGYTPPRDPRLTGDLFGKPQPAAA